MGLRVQQAATRARLEAEHDAFCREWEGVPVMTRNAFARWRMWQALRVGREPEPWDPPFAQAAAMSDAELLRIRDLGERGLAAIRAEAARRGY